MLAPEAPGFPDDPSRTPNRTPLTKRLNRRCHNGLRGAERVLLDGTEPALLGDIMRAAQARTRRIHPAKVTLGALVGLWGVVCAGCSTDSALAPERTWEEVRYHWTESTGTNYGDAVVQATGEVQWDLQGMGVPARGLLAGENLETLTRLIGALPPAGYRGPETDDPRRVFMSVRFGEEVRSYSAMASDLDAPQALREIGGRLESWAQAATSDRRDAVSSRILLSGEQSHIERETRAVVTDRDALLGLLTRIGSGQPGILPSVDFKREIVVGVFLGSRPSAGYRVTVPQAAVTEAGQVVLTEQRTIPGEGCAVSRVVTSPFVLVAVETGSDRDLLFEVQTQTECPTAVR